MAKDFKIHWNQIISFWLRHADKNPVIQDRNKYVRFRGDDGLWSYLPTPILWNSQPPMLLGWAHFTSCDHKCIISLFNLFTYILFLKFLWAFYLYY